MENLLTPPKDMPEYMMDAWIGCLHWAIGEPKILAAFEKDTGLCYRAPRNGLDAMIDESCGIKEKIVQRFVVWFNENVWGPM